MNARSVAFSSLGNGLILKAIPCSSSTEDNIQEAKVHHGLIILIIYQVSSLPVVNIQAVVLGAGVYWYGLDIPGCSQNKTAINKWKQVLLISITTPIFKYTCCKNWDSLMYHSQHFMNTVPQLLPDWILKVSKSICFLSDRFSQCHIYMTLFSLSTQWSRQLQHQLQPND